MMDKIREKLTTPEVKKAIGRFRGVAHFFEVGDMSAEADGNTLADAIEAALSAPVASDARELIREIERDSVAIHRTGAYKAAQLAEDNAAMKTETYVAEQERKAREEEREACAERAVAWQKKLCEDDGWPCRTCTECDQLRAAIKEAGNGR